MASKVGVEFSRLVKILDNIAPLNLAESWDNVGLLIGSSRIKKVHKLLLTNDLTESVLKEAIQNQVQMIFSYHPPIFSGLKRITMDNWQERIVLQCIENSIALYSSHTSLDCISPNGVNDWIVQVFKNQKSKVPIECKASENSLISNAGIGRLITIEPLSINEIIELVKSHFKLNNLRLALANNHNKETKIESIAVCAGSGGSVFKNTKADLFITGELGHHQALDFNHKGISVILTEHSNCERGYLEDVYKNLITKELDKNEDLEIIVSKADHDPLKII